MPANRRNGRKAVAQRFGSGGFRGFRGFYRTVDYAVVDGRAGVAVRDAGAVSRLENVSNRAAEARQTSRDVVIGALRVREGGDKNKNLGVLVGVFGVFLPAFLVIDVLGADVELNASEHGLLTDVTLVEHQGPVEIMLHDLLHTNEGRCNRSMTGEGFGPRVFNGDPENWVAVIFHIMRV